MKKLFFSAVFLMAFSSVSMANTIADEIVLSNDVLLTNPQCMQYAADKCEAYELQWGCMTSSQYNFAFWAHYNRCLDKSISAD